MSKFKPTDEQVNAMDLASSGRSLKVSAFAGAGKTSTLGLISKALTDKRGKRGMYLAFNKAIANEANGRLGKNCSARTFHSLAFREFGTRFGGQLNQRLTSRHIIDSLGIMSMTFKREAFSGSEIASAALMTVSNYCRSLDPELSAKHFKTEILFDLETERGRDLERGFKRMVLPYAQDLWQLMSQPGSFPTTHDVYLKLYAMSNPTIPADFILFDEAQDADPLMMGILQRQSSQVIYVGDRWQQIYGWRGAVNAMEKIQTDSEAYLTQSFRFGPEIAAAATEVLRHMGEPRPVRGNPSLNSTVGSVRQPDAIVCRTNAVAADYFLSELKPGRRIAVTNLSRVKHFLDAVMALRVGQRPRGEYSLFNTVEELKQYSESDAGGDIKPLFKMLETHGNNPAAIKASLDQAVPMNTRGIDLTITTGHQAKGLEWDRVKLPDDFRTEAKTDKEGNEKPIPEEELRLLYVSMTRAKQVVDMHDVDMSFLGDRWKPFTAEGKHQGLRWEEPAPSEATGKAGRRSAQSDLDAPPRSEQEVDVSGQMKMRF